MIMTGNRCGTQLPQPAWRAHWEVTLAERQQSVRQSKKNPAASLRIRGGEEIGEPQVLGGRDFEIQRGAIDDRDARTETFDQVGVIGGDDPIECGALVRAYEQIAAKGLRSLRLP